MAQQGEGEGYGASGSWATRPSGRIVGALVALTALVLVTASDWHGWHLGLFVWGLAVLLAALIYAMISEKAVLRALPHLDEERRALLRSRQRINIIGIMAVGVGAAIAAAGTGWVAVDAVSTVMFLLVGGLSTVVGVRALRRRGEATPE